MWDFCIGPIGQQGLRDIDEDSQVVSPPFANALVEHALRVHCGRPMSSTSGSKQLEGYIGIMEKKMETSIVYCGYTGILEKNMEATI